MSCATGSLADVLADPRWTDDDIAALVPSLVLPLASKDERQAMVPALLSFFGLSPSADEDAVNAALASHAPPASLLSAVEQALRDLLAQGGAATDALGTLIAAPRVTAALQRTAPPPPGTVAAGPLARFAFRSSR